MSLNFCYRVSWVCNSLIRFMQGVACLKEKKTSCFSVLLHISPSASASASPLIHHQPKAATIAIQPRNPSRQRLRASSALKHHLTTCHYHAREIKWAPPPPLAGTSPQKAKTLDAPKPKANPDPESQPIPAACFLVLHQCWLILMMWAAHSLY